MKAKLKTIAMAGLLSIGLSQNACALSFTPHLGIDYKFWQVEPKQSDAGADFTKVFPDITRAGTLYVGTRINKVWGIDFGYDRSSQKHKWRTYDTQQLVFGQPATIGDASQVDVRLAAWYLSGLFYWEVYQNLEIVFHAGAGWLQPKTTVIYYPVATGSQPVELSFKEESKVSGRFGFGMQYLFLDHFGVRALVTFDQTRRINYVGTNQNVVSFDISPYKSATSYNVGIFAEFNAI